MRALGRPYHSYDHPPPPGVFNAAERAILSAAYAHVPEHGFSQHALSLGARDAGYPDISASVLPDGPFSLIRYHLVSKREALAPRSEELFGAAGAPQGGVSVEDKVERLTWERLLENRNVIHRWQEVCNAPSRHHYHPALAIFPRGERDRVFLYPPTPSCTPLTDPPSPARPSPSWPSPRAFPPR